MKKMKIMILNKIQILLKIHKNYLVQEVVLKNQTILKLILRKKINRLLKNMKIINKKFKMIKKTWKDCQKYR